MSQTVVATFAARRGTRAALSRCTSRSSWVQKRSRAGDPPRACPSSRAPGSSADHQTACPRLRCRSPRAPTTSMDRNSLSRRKSAVGRSRPDTGEVVSDTAGGHPDAAVRHDAAEENHNRVARVVSRSGLRARDAPRFAPDPWGALPRIAGLAMCPTGLRRTGTVVLVIGCLVPPRSTAPHLSPA